MTIEAVRLFPYRLPLRDPWPTAEGTITERYGCLLALEDSEGRTGLGDTAPIAGFGLETIASSIAALRTAARRLIGLPESTYLEAAANLPHLASIAATPAARHAIDLALHDLAAQLIGRPIAALLDEGSALTLVPANAAIPRVDPTRAATLAREAVAAGVQTLKLKVGGDSFREDLARVRAVRDEVGAHVAIRLDANQAWREDKAIAAIRAFAVYDIEYVEQPVAAAEIAALARVRRSVDVPIAADESLTDLKAARRLIEANAVSVFIIKPMVLGGLSAARAVAALARKHDIEVIVTSLIESAVGRTGAIHLAASLGPSHHAHGIATSGALQRDVAEGPGMERGAVRVPTAPGLGVSLPPEKLRSTAPVEAA